MYASPFSFDAERGAISSIQRTLILKTFPGFAALSAEQLATMSTICRERFFKAGTRMVEPEKPVHAFFLVVEGEASIRREGKEVQRMGPRTTVGGLAAITQDPRGADAIAATDVLALEVDTEDMAELFEDSFALLAQVLFAMARTVRDLQMALGRPIVANDLRPPLTQVKQLTLVDKVLILRNSAGVGIKEVEALSVLAASTEEVRYAATEALWSPGDVADASLAIISGEVRCAQPGRATYSVGPGSLIGSHDSLAQMPRHYHAQAHTPVRALRLRRDALLDMLEDYSDMAQLTLRQMAQGVTAMIDALAQGGGKEIDGEAAP